MLLAIILVLRVKKLAKALSNSTSYCETPGWARASQLFMAWLSGRHLRIN